MFGIVHLWRARIASLKYRLLRTLCFSIPFGCYFLGSGEFRICHTSFSYIGNLAGLFFSMIRRFKGSYGLSSGRYIWQEQRFSLGLINKKQVISCHSTNGRPVVDR